MAEQTKIQWATHTFNPWRGCVKVAAGCTNCYAETLSKRNPAVLGIWGSEESGATRVVASEAMWKEPIKWNREASCRRCGECAGQDHHWIEHWSPETESSFACKHCSAVADGCLDCCNGHELGPSGSVTDRPCRACGGLGVHSVREFMPRVFCASLADVFEDWGGPMVDSQGENLQVCPTCGTWGSHVKLLRTCGLNCSHRRPLTMDDVRARLFRLIDATPNLTWQILTKRPENIPGMWPVRSNPNCSRCRGDGCDPEEWAPWRHPMQMDPDPCRECVRRDNVHLCTSVSNQDDVDRNVPLLLKCRDLSPVLGLSVEPLIGPVDLSPAWYVQDYMGDVDVPCGQMHCLTERCSLGLPTIDHVIVGGESGPRSRPCSVDWIRSVVRQCAAAGVPCFVKQLGSNAGWNETDSLPLDCGRHELVDRWRDAELSDPKGGNPDEWPEDLKVTEDLKVRQLP